MNATTGITGIAALGLPKVAEAEVATESAEEAPVELQGKIYTCLPAQKWRIGKFRFEKGQLHLTKESEMKEFDNLLEGLPVVDRARIKTVDLDEAQKIAAGMVPRATRGFDGGLNREADALAKATPKIGTLDQGTKESGN